MNYITTNFKTKCSEDILLQLFGEHERFFYFLVGPNVEFDQVHVQVLGKESWPPLMKSSHSNELKKDGG